MRRSHLADDPRQVLGAQLERDGIAEMAAFAREVVHFIDGQVDGGGAG